MTTNKIRASFLDKASLYPDDLDFSALEEVASWQWFDNGFDDTSPGDMQHCLENAEILVSNKVLISREIIANSKQLKLICVAATGVNNVDLEAAKKRGVQVCNVRAYATSSVVQHVFSLILALNRKLYSYNKSVTKGDWSRSEFFCYFGETISELEGKTLGIIGFGELGKAVAKVAACFGMKVLLAKRDASDLREGRTDLNTLLSQADVVTLHCPLTENNRHILGAKEFAVMRHDAILINAARGGLVDEMALLHALEKKEIGAAALDVLEEEPPSVNNVLINYRADNLIITPHIAWASRESRQRLVNEIAENIRAFKQGQPRNVV
ncbi:MAG: glycerate dehydrogenase [Gammaproteobacteria bacterium]|nr:glycerate dehydrogenase [Gammaproteobacteria bacterium]